MSFLSPNFLFALLAIGIPILIHLFNFRRFKKIYFSDIRFLKEIKVISQNQNRLKHFLVLLSRILAITFLVLAFAQPFIPSSKQATTGKNAVSVYVDNSFSMENISKNGMLLDEAKKLARDIALAHSQTDLFQLLTNDFEGKHQRLVSREDFLTMLDEVKISPAVKKISEIIARQSDALSKGETKNKKSFIISDFQKSISDFENIKADSSVKTILIPVSANQQNNLYIDSCWLSSPAHQLNSPEELHVRIKNISENNLENISLKLFLNNQQKTPSSFSIAANETKDISLSFVTKEPGIQQGRIEITDYPITYDDILYFSFDAGKQCSISCISPSSSSSSQSEKSLQSLFNKDSLFKFKIENENRVDYSSLSSNQLIVLCELNSISSGLAQEVTRFVQNGGSVIVFPSTDLDTLSYNNFLSPLGANHFISKDTANNKVDWINFENEIFADVFEKKAENIDLPIVHSYYLQSHTTHTNEDVILKLKNGNSFFSKYTFKEGLFYLSAVPLNLEWSNLTKHAIFVPLMYKIAMNSQPSSTLFYTLGKNNPIAIKTHPKTESIFKIKGNKNFEIIPEIKTVDLQSTLFVHDQIKEANNYTLLATNEIISGISFNYDRKESNLSRYSPDELTSIYEKENLNSFSIIDAGNKDIANILSDISQGKKLWKWCILLALLFLATETIFLRLWK